MLRTPPISTLFPYTTLFRSMPTMFNGDQAVQPIGRQVIYYKSGVLDYRSVRPSPPGLRYVVGSPNASLDDFKNRSEEHTSELQSLAYLVCRLLLEKKK